ALIDLAPMCIRQMTGLLGDDSGVKLTDLPGLQRLQGLREYRTQRDRGMGQGRPDKGGFSAGQTDFGLNTFTPHRRRNPSIGFSSFSLLDKRIGDSSLGCRDHALGALELLEDFDV